MLDRLSEALTNAGIPMERVEGLTGSPVLVFQAAATTQQRADAQAMAAAFDWSAATDKTWRDARQRARDAVILELVGSSNERVLRALLLTLIDELNSLRSWLRSFKTETAAATNLANFQTRVAALPNLPDRTARQARTSIAAKITAGDADI